MERRGRINITLFIICRIFGMKINYCDIISFVLIFFIIHNLNGGERGAYNFCGHNGHIPQMVANLFYLELEHDAIILLPLENNYNSINYSTPTKYPFT